MFDRLLKSPIERLPVDKIYSSGYALHKLEVSVWCLLTTDNIQGISDNRQLL
jgi:hypothetical protein